MHVGQKERENYFYVEKRKESVAAFDMGKVICY